MAPRRNPGIAPTPPEPLAHQVTLFEALRYGLPETARFIGRSVASLWQPPEFQSLSYDADAHMLSLFESEE